MAAVSKNIAMLYAIKIIQGEFKMSDVPSAYRTYVEIYVDQMRRK